MHSKLHPEAFVLIPGDPAQDSSHLHRRGLSTFVDSPPREGRALDLLYVNVKQAYTPTALPPPQWGGGR